MQTDARETKTVVRYIQLFFDVLFLSPDPYNYSQSIAAGKLNYTAKLVNRLTLRTLQMLSSGIVFI